jgi:hypothetical protein
MNVTLKPASAMSFAESASKQPGTTSKPGAIRTSRNFWAGVIKVCYIASLHLNAPRAQLSYRLKAELRKGRLNRSDDVIG